MNYPQGSVWRKWDLHVHTPASIVHNYGGNEAAAWNRFLADIEALPAEFKVIGVNDYLFLDGYRRLCDERANGRLKNIDLLLPVIELRLDKFVGHDSHFQRVNFHVIFDVIDPEIIQTQFINVLSRDFRLLPEHAGLQHLWAATPTRQSLTDLGAKIIDAAPADRRAQYGAPLLEGFRNFNVALDNVRKALESSYFRGRFLTAVGKTEWASIQWNDVSIAEKRNTIHSADIVFISSATVSDFQTARDSLVKANVNSRLLDCSDAHSCSDAEVKDRIGKCFTWMKADTTFAGLQHAIKEYAKRVYIGDEPEKSVSVRNNKTRYIESISIKKVPGSSLPETWFDCDIPLNKDLVAIIGNKGSGKSALADTLGLLGDSQQGDHFSFLNEMKFRDPKNNKARHFTASLTWTSGVVVTKRLDESPSAEAVETVKYLPQDFVETVCNELATAGDSKFDRELKKIIFKHVGRAERLGHDSLDDVLAYKTQETNTTIRVLAGELHDINVEIVRCEDKSSDAHRIQLESQLRLKQEELATHDRVKPAVVAEPTRSDEAKQIFERVGGYITKKKEELVVLDSAMKEADKKRAELFRRVTVIDKAVGKIGNFRRQFEDFKRTLVSDLADLGIDPPIGFDALVSFNVEPQKLNTLRLEYQAEIDKTDLQLDVSKEDSLTAKQQFLQNEIHTLQESLDEPNRKYVAYQTGLEKWHETRAALVGDPTIQNSLTWIQGRLEELKALPAQLETLRKQRQAKSREIFREIVRLTEAYKQLYRPVQDFIEGQRISSEQIPLKFEVTIAQDGFQRGFLERINRQVRGTFSGIDESDALLRRLLQAIDFNDEDSAVTFVEEVHASLNTDRRPGAPDGNVQGVADQLRKGETVVSIYDFLFSLSFLVPRYTLEYGGREIYQLSPGERGLLLLVFYLLIDKDDIPLVMDQPEENLDNQTIYEVLVKCLTNVKKRRQVIVVTHNPNLAVVCDAEQVIYAHRDKGGIGFRYSSGAIENPLMNKHVIDVLEGTRPAFDNRDSKYFA